MNLGATKLGTIRQITLPFLMPAILASAIVSVLMSFENFNTALMLVGSDSPLTITLFDKLKQGSTPVLNAVSLLAYRDIFPADAGAFCAACSTVQKLMSGATRRRAAVQSERI